MDEVKGVESYQKVNEDEGVQYDIIVRLESGGLLEANLSSKEDLESLYDAIKFFSKSGEGCKTRVAFYPTNPISTGE